MAQLALEQIPSTENHYLVDVIKKHRGSTLMDEISKLRPDDGMVSLSAVKAIIQNHHSVKNQSIEEFEAQELQVILKAYLQVAKKRYIDHIVQLQNAAIATAVESISNLHLSMNEKQLLFCLGEDRNSQQRRANLTREVHVLKDAMDELQLYQ
jgi:hypothetical protein